MNVNHIVMSGNLTREPELRSTKTGRSVLLFCIASNDRRKNPSTGEWEDVPNYIDCMLSGNRAEGLSKRLAKGMKVVVEGKLRWSSWEKDGHRRTKHEIIVDEIDFLSQQTEPRQEKKPQAEPKATAGNPEFDDLMDDDIFF